LNTIKYLLNYGSCSSDSRVFRLTLSEFGIVLWERMVWGVKQDVTASYYMLHGKIIGFRWKLITHS